MNKRFIIGLLVMFASMTFSVTAQQPVEPFVYWKEKKDFRFILPDGQVYETWNVIIVSIPARVKMDGPEFNARIAATLPLIYTEYWPWIPIYTSHPIKGRRLLPTLKLVGPPKVPFR